MSEHITWTPEATARLQRAPAFLRGMVKNVTEKRAREADVYVVDEAFLSGVRDAAMPGGRPPEPTIPEAGSKAMVWTKEAGVWLNEIPEFTRDIMRKIIEEIAAERGHLEVNCKLLDQVETLVSTAATEPVSVMAWTADAEAMLAQRLAEKPQLASEFMHDLLRVDAEDLAHEIGVKQITAAVLQQAWERPLTPVSWSPEARARLNDAPDFVRSGIKKAAERRARREGLAEISSEALTRFRNAAMLKAVKRMRAFGFRELTFDNVFETASGRVKRLKNNPQAAQRFAEIRQHVESKEDGVGLMGHQFVQKMKDYLKE